MTGESPEISVVLVSWNRREDLRIALDSLYQQVGVEFEIIVVDNGSTDGTLEMLESEPRRIRTIKNERNRGACWGKNQGILSATTPYLVFMDSDAKLVSSSTLKTVLNRLKSDPGLTALGCPIYWNEELTNPWVFGIHLTDDLYIDWDKTRTLGVGADALSTCFLMMRTDSAREIGGFDPVFFYQHEDLDFFVRLGRAAGKFDVLVEPPIWHRISQEGRKVDRWFWMHFREEWRHQYMLIKSKGPIQAVGLIFRNWSDSQKMRDYYVRPIRFRKFFVLFGILPIFMLLLSPLILWQGSKNYLDDPKLAHE